jgi:hypothetical protein
MQPEKCNVPGTAAKNEEGQILKKQMQGSWVQKEEDSF